MKIFFCIVVLMLLMRILNEVEDLNKINKVIEECLLLLTERTTMLMEVLK